MSKIACITGASSGFGKACAEKFASHRYDLIITGRREEKLNELKSELEKKFGVRIKVLAFDIRNKKSTIDAVNNLDNSWKKIQLLINNAGLALGRDYFDEADLEDWDTMIDTNVKGLLYITKALLPNLIDAGSAHIINIGSTAGKEVYEKGNTYCASKFAVGALSEAMRIDLLRHGIKVTVIHPGAAETEFSLVRFKGDASKAKAVYDGIKALSANDVADTIYYCTTLPAHVCINELVLTCTQQANSFYFYKG
ncbi:MAG: NAD(P)-dependent oxidoreductase [Bacteroidetes bacterium]|nr:MAG: NAD(P)-dependent oxidoreductase [Bacteroidota bacterium]